MELAGMKMSLDQRWRSKLACNMLVISHATIFLDFVALSTALSFTMLSVCGSLFSNPLQLTCHCLYS